MSTETEVIHVVSDDLCGLSCNYQCFFFIYPLFPIFFRKISSQLLVF